MAAPFGNKNAEKWTFRKSIELFHAAIDLTNLKDGNGYKYDFIGEIARELGTFKDIFSHLVDRFPSLQRLKNQLYTNIEQNCYWNGKKGLIKEASALMNLKANWKWQDRQIIDQNVNNNNLPDLSNLTYEQLLKLRDGNTKNS